ncbi:MAG: ATPase [Paludibacteraceae bacterium]|nr:ATPase [Paludibacteraceae bacterium]
MELTVDSGSTKAKWVFTDGGEVVRQVFTAGINAAQQSRVVIAEEMAKVGMRGVERIRFYGAGCIGGEVNEVIREELVAASGCSDVSVESDIVGAAVGTLGDRRGIVCILGTGANAVLWDGVKVVGKVNAGGYILGDEGSGAVMGRELISDYVKGLTPGWLTEVLEREYGLSYSVVVEKVYRQPMANRWLAGFAKLLGMYREEEYVRELVEGTFRRFVKRNVCRFEGWQETDCVVVGSVGYYFEKELRKICDELGVRLVMVKKEPI